jgi:ribonuclease HII
MSKEILLKSSFKQDASLIEVGLDEAGRGALAGPVTVAACVMPYDFQHPLIKDSKLLSGPQRTKAVELVKKHAIAYHVEHVPVSVIEDTNILKATMYGMKRCLDEVSNQVDRLDFILVDGDQFHGWNGVSFETVVGGDNKYTSIAAASILAKTSRDGLMKELSEHSEFFAYGWNSNKGYGTKQHTDMIKEKGASEHHRESFISHLLTSTGQLF